jgi:hypothetical protein
MPRSARPSLALALLPAVLASCAAVEPMAPPTRQSGLEPPDLPALPLWPELDGGRAEVPADVGGDHAAPDAPAERPPADGPAIPGGFEPACTDALVGAVLACLAGQDAPPGGAWEHVDACTDVEAIAPARDRWCGGGGASDPDCALPLERWYTTVWPTCVGALRDLAWQQRCPFPPTRNAFFHTPHLRALECREIRTTDGLLSHEQEQLVQAVQASVHTVVTTVEQALQRVDEGVVEHCVWLDLTSHRTWVGWIYGVGDSTYGRIFAPGGRVPAADVIDSDVLRCRVGQGPALRPCAPGEGCGAGLACRGATEGGAGGRCLPASTDPLDGAPCADDGSCQPAASMHLCLPDGEGARVCLPAWHQTDAEGEGGREVPDGGTLEALAVVPGPGGPVTALHLWVHMEGAPVDDVALTLVSPDGAHHPVPVEAARRQSARTPGVPVALPAGTPAAGTWRLQVRDRRLDDVPIWLEAWRLRVERR